jgi:Asp-tRNA(Asn)/Glu-tRNA(Gln) amidotransferase A subunit family amidase
VSELTIKPAVDLLAMLQQRSISSFELAQEHVREIERLDPLLHAFVDFDPDRVLRAARQADQQSHTRSPLLGLPMTVKSSIAAAGHRCEIGSILNRGFIPEEDALVVQRMRQAGAVLLGTTNCPEFLMAYETDNLLYGATANPWSLGHSPGGSSGGEAAAIAAGISAGGIGSDSGGSVREPAHFTGICSLKPTPGRIPGKGHIPPCVGPFSMLGAVGPMARTVRDVSLFFQILSGQDVADPAGAPVSLRPIAEEQLRSQPIAVLEDDGFIPVTIETRNAVRSAAIALEERGFQIRPFQSKMLEEARLLWWKFFVRCGRMLLEPLIQGRETELSATFRYFLDTARSEPLLSGEELLDAWTRCDQVRARLLGELSPYSVLLSPVCSIPAFRHGEREWFVEGRKVEYFSAMRFTQWFNLLAAPAAVVPVGRSPEGLPIGVQIASLPYRDEVVLAVAEILDQDFGYHAPPTALSPEFTT